jgi:hypothetical protein
MAVATRGERKKLAPPPIMCRPSARPRCLGSTKEEIIGGAAGWYPPPNTPIRARKTIIIPKLCDKPTKKPAMATPQIPRVIMIREPIRSASHPPGNCPIP